jgi:diamine N-acetyltransferase
MLLESENIKLRAVEPEDLDVLYRWENDTELWKYGSSLAPYSKFSLKEYIKKSCSDLLIHRQLRLMAVYRHNNTTIGTIDLYDYDPINLRAGVGILIDKNYRNLGLGKEILSLLSEYATQILHLHQLYAFIPVKNKVSIALFLSCNYKKSGILHDWLKTDKGFEDVAVMQRAKQEQ